jgi:hypothetical protein
MQLADSKKLADPRVSTADVWNLSVILSLCCVFAYLRSLKLDSRVWGDTALWLS